MSSYITKLDELFPDGRSVIFAFDHGFEHGPEDFNYRKTRDLVKKIVESGVDGIMLLPGLARIYREIWLRKTNLVLKLTSKTNLRPEAQRFLQSPIGYVEEAIDLGATAVAATVYWGAPEEDLMVERWTNIRREANRLGIPCIQLAYPRGPHIENRYDFKIVAYGVRAAIESGANAIKTYYTGSYETFKKVINVAEGIPVLMAGGPKAKDFLSFLKQIKECLEAGCKGVAVGRNVFQNENPAKAAKAILRVVHDELEPEEAIKT